MPSKSKATDTGAIVSEDAIRQRAYFLWEADGRPEGTGDHYWNLAHHEATKLLVEASSNGAAKACNGKSPGVMPPITKATKATKAKVKEGPAKSAKAAKAETVKPVKVKAAKAVAEPKPAKKAATKPRAAVPGAGKKK